MSADGKALGVLSTLGPRPARRRRTASATSAKELAYAQQNSGISGLQLVNGTEPFAPVL